MQTTYRLNADELTEDFLVSLQTLFRHKPIEIVVSELNSDAEAETLHEILGLPADEPLNESTVYLFGHEANRKHLENVMSKYESGENMIGFATLEDLQAFVKENAT
jgi:hypothetical protein